jgi:TolB-like protein/predicted Zn-dependent protease
MLIGTRLGHYRILERIGTGGMGEVYRAHDDALQRDVAIKVLPAATAEDEAARSRLLREARAAAALNHPHICTVYEVGEAGGRTFIAMELVEGSSLDRLISGGALPADDVLRYGFQIADAVALAHTRGILHRDLKTANVMITPARRAKVLDFGLAKRLDRGDHGESTTVAQATVTHAGVLIGTLAYMAPEQLRGQMADARSDVWAIGVILYEAVTGERPFAGQTPFEVSAAILNEPHRPFDHAVQPAALQQLIERCLAKEPERRYQDAGELRAALETIHVDTAPTKTSIGRERSRGRAAAGITALAVAIATVAAFDVGGLRSRFLRPGTHVDSLAVLPLQNLSGDPEQEYLATGVHEALTTELGQLPGLRRVTARGSTRRFKDSDLPARAIAAQLGVSTLVTGAVQRSGDNIRVTAQVVDATTERPIWGRTFDRDVRQILQLQNDMVAEIADALGLALTSDDRQRLGRSKAIDPATHEAYLKGMDLLHRGTPPDRRKGMELLQEAVDRDKGNAHGWAALAAGYATIGHGPAATPDAWSRARAAANNAIMLDPNLAEAHAALADVKLYGDWDWAGAERAFLRANELNPNLAFNHYHYAWYLVLVDRVAEAIAEHKRAQELDPFTPVHTAYLGTLYGWEGRHADALTEARKAIEFSPNGAAGWIVLSAVQSSLGRHDEAIQAAERVVSLAPLQVALLGHAYARAGRLDEARKVLADLEAAASTPFRAHGLAGLHTQLGNADKALEWLNFEPHHAFVPWARVDPLFAPLRNTPGFAKFLDRLKLPAPR